MMKCVAVTLALAADLLLCWALDALPVLCHWAGDERAALAAANTAGTCASLMFAQRFR